MSHRPSAWKQLDYLLKKCLSTLRIGLGAGSPVRHARPDLTWARGAARFGAPAVKPVGMSCERSRSGGSSPLLLFAEELGLQTGLHLGNFLQGVHRLALIDRVTHVIDERSGSGMGPVVGDPRLV
jgi:hypothetical protein